MSVFPLCSVKTTQKSSLLLSRPLSETNFSLKLAAQHNITSALQGESAAPKTLRNMQVMNFLSFNSLFSCKGRSFVFSPSPENEKKKRIKGWFSVFSFVLEVSLAKRKKHPPQSTWGQKKAKVLPTWKLIWAVADVFSVRLSCRRDVRASPLPPIQLLAASETGRDRTGRALTSSHPPQNAIK